MKIPVVYYTFDGDTKFIGDAIAKELNADVLELKLVVDMKSKDFIKNSLGKKQILMKTEPLLKPYYEKPNQYDVLIIGTPIWSGTYAPAIRTFLHAEIIRDKLIGLFYCFTVKQGRISKHMKKALKGNTIISEIGFRDPLKEDKELALNQVKKWAESFSKCVKEKNKCLN
ncbi:MAG: flavodoxin family protein [Candidatus Heimdallarchaeota archaeon]|nr:flavodoxin family protein [Candidatus Heimdallarchaeota archaeon]